MSQEEVITVDDIKKLVPSFRTRIGEKVLQFLFSVTDMEKVNRAYKNASQKEGIDFITLLLQECGVEYTIDNPEELDKLPQGFITVSNHPYGGLDGIILIHLIASRNPKFKIMVNWILNYIKAMSNYFICVDPVSTKVSTISLSGVKLTQEHLSAGNPMGFFPSGSVSKLKYKSGLHIEDREWQPTISKLIKSAQMPIVPIYFHGHNSFLFYLLGLIHWKIRTLRLPCELFNKKGKKIRISIGKPISVEEQNKHKDIYEFGEFLKAQTYQLRKK